MTRAADGLDDIPPPGGPDDYGAIGGVSVSPPERRFDLIPFAEINYSAGQRWLVKGLLASTGLAVIFGAKKEYKSFISLDLALHIVTGRPWAGRRVKQGAVVYLCAEGASGFSDRVAANRERDGLPSDLPFFLIKAKPNLGMGEGDTMALIAAVEPVVETLTVPLVAIFLDTVVRTLAGSSENDEGMRNFTDNAETIAEHFDCLTVGIHHVGKDANRGMRGSSALGGAVVTSWRVEKTKSMQARVTLEDAKDGESGLTWLVDLERFVFGHDEDGDEEDVLVVRDVGGPVPEGASPATTPATDRAPPPQLRLVMACLDAAMVSSKRARPYPDGPEIAVVPLEMVRIEYFARRGDETSDDAKRKSFMNSIKTGLERRLILVETVGSEKVIWKAKAGN